MPAFSWCNLSAYIFTKPLSHNSTVVVPSQKYLQDGRDEISVAIIGRPNVGKSSILNRLLGEDRAIVSDIAGTTRDTIDAMVSRPNGGQLYRLIDTAGVRQKNKVCVVLFCLFHLSE